MPIHLFVGTIFWGPKEHVAGRKGKALNRLLRRAWHAGAHGRHAMVMPETCTAGVPSDTTGFRPVWFRLGILNGTPRKGRDRTLRNSALKPPRRRNKKPKAGSSSYPFHLGEGPGYPPLERPPSLPCPHAAIRSSPDGIGPFLSQRQILLVLSSWIPKESHASWMVYDGHSLC